MEMEMSTKHRPTMPVLVIQRTLGGQVQAPIIEASN